MNKKVNVLHILLAMAGLFLANTVSAYDFGGLSDPFDWLGGGNGYDHYGGPYGGYGYPGTGGYGTGYPGGYPGTGGYGLGYPGGYPGIGGYGTGYPGGLTGPGGYDYGYPGYGGQAPGYSGYDSGPAPGAQAAEIEHLKARIKRLEQANRSAPSTFNNTGNHTMQGFRGQPEHQWPAPHTGSQYRFPEASQPATGQPESPVYRPGYGGVHPRYRFQ